MDLMYNARAYLDNLSVHTEQIFLNCRGFFIVFGVHYESSTLVFLEWVIAIRCPKSPKPM